MAQVQQGPLLPERREGCGAHGCFGACREAQFLAPTCYGCRVEWALDKEEHRVSTYGKEEVQCQNTGPSATAGVRDFVGGERRGGMAGPWGPRSRRGACECYWPTPPGEQITLTRNMPFLLQSQTDTNSLLGSPRERSGLPTGFVLRQS